MLKRRGRPKKVVDNFEIENIVTEFLPEVEKGVVQPKIVRSFSKEQIAMENKRKQVMWVSVGFVMVLVFFVWVVNLKKIVSVNAMDIGSIVKIDDLKKGFSANYKQFSTNISAIKTEIASTTKNIAQSTTTADETFNTNIDEVNKGLIKMIGNSSSTINNK